MPPISDFRSDSPLNLASVEWSYLGWFDDLNFGRVLPVVTIERFCWHSDVREFQPPRSNQRPSSQTRNCFQPHSSQWFSASSDLWYAGVAVVLKLSLEPVVDLNRAAQLLPKSAATLSTPSVRNPKQTTDRKEFIMHQSRGAVSFTALFTTDDIGLRKDASVEHVVKVFLTVGEAMAARWIEMPRGILLLQAVPDRPASGAIYLYDRERHIFFFVDFVDGRDDTLTAAEFDQLVAEYDLVSWTANPAFLSSGNRQYCHGVTETTV